MIQPRKLNSSMPKIDPPNIARDGGAKRIVDAPIKAGMKRVTQGEPAAYHHGVTVDDLPNSKIVKSHERTIGFHSGMTDKQIINVANNSTAGQVLTDASKLGKA
jgi:hypothetical protein